MEMQIKKDLDKCEGYEVEDLGAIGVKYTRHDNLVAYIINEKSNKIEVISYKHHQDGEVIAHFYVDIELYTLSAFVNEYQVSKQ